MDYSQPFTYFANADTTILASIAIEGQEQEIEMARIAAAPGFAINYDKDRFEQKEEVSGMTSFMAKAGGLSAQFDCWKYGKATAGADVYTEFASDFALIENYRE